MLCPKFIGSSEVFEGNWVRARAKIKVAEPLVRFTPLNIEGEERLLLPGKYEKIAYFCEVHGIMGHILEECGNGIHDTAEGPLKADPVEKKDD